MKEFFLHLFTYFTGISSKFFTQLEPVLVTEAGKLWAQLVPLAVPVVTALISSSLSGTDKQSAAVASLKSAAETAGIQAGVDVLNSSVEIAYQIAKANLPASSSPAA
jgi:antitoxin (DNA-binding transcriptional repressor) of toxin-antitoxin stability system